MGRSIGLESVRVNVYLVLLPETAEGGNLGNPGNCLEVVAQVPLLVGAHVREAVPSRFIHEGILEDPAKGSGIRPEFCPDTLGQRWQHGGEVFLGPRPGPVDVRAIFEDDVYIGVTEVGETPHRLDLGSPQHCRHDRIGDLVLDHVGAAVPAGVDDHLGVAQVRDGVKGHVLHGPPAGNAGYGHQGQNDKLVVNGKIDDAVNHGLSFGMDPLVEALDARRLSVRSGDA